MAYIPQSGSVVSFEGGPWTTSVVGTVTTAQSGAVRSSISGTVFVDVISSVAVVGSFTPSGNQSVSGTVGASIIGLTPVAVTNTPSISGTVLVGGTPTINIISSVGTVNVGGNITVNSIYGNISGSVVAFQGAGWSGSVAATITNTNLNVSGSVAAWLNSSSASVITLIQGSVAVSITPAANQSVSGTVGASVIGLTPVAVTNTPSISGTVNIGNFPTTQNVSGSVAAFVVGNASVITVAQSSVAVAIVSGSIAATFTPPANQSVSGTVNIAGNPSISGTVNIGAAFSATDSAAFNAYQFGIGATGTAATIPYLFNGTNFDRQRGNSSVGSFVHVGAGSVITVAQSSVAVAIVSGSIAATFTPPANQSVSGTVGASIIGVVPVTQSGTLISSVVSTVPSSVLVGASIFGQLPGGTAVLGSVAALQGTNPWNIAGSVAAFLPGNASVITVPQGSIAVAIISGSIAASFTPPANQSVSGAVNVSSLLSIPAIVSTANSTTAPVTSTLSFTGTGEEWKDFGSIVVNVFTDAASGTDGLSIQQSSNNTNWDIQDTYTVPSMAAGQGKTFQVQPAARFGRVVYTQGAVNSGAFRLQTVYHPQMVKPSSQRPQDAYSNETDLEQNQSFGMLYNGATWDRMRGNTNSGLNVSVLGNHSVSGTLNIAGNPSISGQVGASIIGTVPVVQSGTVISSISGGIQGFNAPNASVTGNPVYVGGLDQNGSVQGAKIVTVVSVAGGLAWLGITSVSGTVAATQSGTQITSLVGSYSEDAGHTSGDTGVFTMGVRNDTLSSITSADLDYSPHIVGPMGETIMANSPITKWVSGTASMLGGTPVTGSLVPIIAAQGSSVFTYITGVQIANASGTNAWITLLGATNSVVGYTVAPANGGSNIYYPNALKTNANAIFSASISAVASVYLSAQGFISKT